MDLETLVNLINSVGFPIFVCIVLFWFIKNTLLKFANKLDTLNQSIILLTEKIGNIKNV